MKNTVQIKKYDVSILSMFKTITTMTIEDRDLLLKEIDVFARKIKSRATRENCDIIVEFVNSRGIYTATIENISLTGAFIACRVPIMIDEKIFIHFGQGTDGSDVKIQARIVRSTVNGFGVQFIGLDDQDTKFLQNCMAPAERS